MTWCACLVLIFWSKSALNTMQTDRYIGFPSSELLKWSNRSLYNHTIPNIVISEIFIVTCVCIWAVTCFTQGCVVVWNHTIEYITMEPYIISTQQIGEWNLFFPYDYFSTNLTRCNSGLYNVLNKSKRVPITMEFKLIRKCLTCPLLSPMRITIEQNRYISWLLLRSNHEKIQIYCWLLNLLIMKVLFS